MTKTEKDKDDPLTLKEGGGRCLRAASQGNKRYLQIKAKDKSTKGEKRNSRNTRTFMQKEKCEPFCISVWK